MTEDVTDHRRGRNLTLISFFIIVYVVAGGEFVSQTGLGGFAVRFERPHLLERAGLLLFVFTLFQFCIDVKPRINATGQIINHYTRKNKLLKRKIEERGNSDLRRVFKGDDAQYSELKDTKLFKGLDKSEAKIESFRVSWNLPNKSPNVEINGVGISDKTGLEGSFFTDLYTTVAIAYVGDNRNGFKVKIQKNVYALVRCLSFIRALGHFSPWTDFFPFVMAGLAVCFMFVRVIGCL